MLEQKVAAVELDARLVGVDGHATAAAWVGDGGGNCQLACLVAQHKVVVIAEKGAVQQGADVFTNRLALAEVQRRAGDIGECAGGDEGVVGSGAEKGSSEVSNELFSGVFGDVWAEAKGSPAISYEAVLVGAEDWPDSRLVRFELGFFLLSPSVSLKSFN